MNRNDIFSWLLDAVPYRVTRRSAGDWILPASIGLGVGAAVGIGVGMLLAPRTGEETREKLRHGANQLREKARMAAHRARHEIAEKANGAVDQLDYEMDRVAR
jgi:gas vesicle protein